MKIWNVSKLNKDAVGSIMADADVPQLAACVLAARGVETGEEARRLLSDNEELHDPFLMKDMDKAVDRILFAIENGERICVYGDYDADGVCSTALLFSNLSDIGADVFSYIPSRQNEGYGLNAEAVDKIASQRATLIITVDNGVSAADEIDYAASVGIDTIVTDHHKPGDKLPNAVAVLNPHRIDCRYPFKDLCGVGVAFKLAAALVSDTVSQQDLLYEYADLITIGTIGDIVPLVGENRQFVKKGLEIIRDMPRPGVTALIDVCAIDSQKITSGKIAYSLVPRINACGRLGTSQLALDALLCEDERSAAAAARELDDSNAERRRVEAEVLQSAVEVIESTPGMKYKSIIVVSGQNWNHGVAGIVASHIRERYGRPAVVISVSDGIGKGSGRSIEGFSLVDAVFACKNLLLHYGGHPMAAGMTLPEENIEAFSEMINAYADDCGEMPYPALNIDLKLNPAGLSVGLVRELEYLEPYGAGNPQPVFGLYNMKIAGINEVGGGKHLRLSVCRNDQYLTVMYFSHSKDDFVFGLGDTVDIAATLDINEYGGAQSVSVIARGIKLSEENPVKCLQSLRIYERMSINKHLNPQELAEILPIRADFAAVYREIKKQPELRTNLSALWHTFGGKITCGKICVILKAMSELSLISCERLKDVIVISALEYEGKADLTKAPVMKKLRGEG